MMTQGAVAAPAAPGRLGRPARADQVLPYLDALGGWRDARRRELDELDRAALGSPDHETLSPDIVLSMALWKAVADRHDELLATWDSGRVGRTELERISALVWGRLDTAPGSLNVTLPEACRLSDALSASLRARLALDAGSADAARVAREVRQQVERIRDLVTEAPSAERPAAADRLLRLERRLEDFVGRAKRGADVGGLAESLVADSAVAERDLIVAAASRSALRELANRAQALTAELTSRSAQVRVLREQCVAVLTPAPRFAVPDVAALGPVPGDRPALEAYLTRLEKVGRALEVARAAYRSAIDEVPGLEGRLDGYRAKARASGAEADDLVELERRARAELGERPVDVRRLRALVAAYQAYLSAHLAAPTTRDPGGAR